jgi:hypothetical protein
VIPRTLVHTMRLAAILAVPACSSDDVDYSVATTKPVRSASRFEVDRSDYRIRQVLTLGTADGDSTEVFGFVTDAAFGPRGSIYVADGGQRRIVAFDSSGRFLRSIGRPGQGPGEFLDPSSLAWIADTLFVYDGGQGRIIVLDTTGLFQRSFPSPSAWVDHVRPSARNTLLFTIAADSFVIHEVSTAGGTIGKYVRRPRVEETLPPEAIPAPGPTCASGTGFLYANHWRYELVRFAFPPGREVEARQYPSRLLRPRRPGGAGTASVAPAGGVLGLVCTDSQSLFGYVDKESGRIHYDVFDDGGHPLARWEFWRDQEPDYPGFLVDTRGGRLLAFRSRPFPQVGVWLIERARE